MKLILKNICLGVCLAMSITASAQVYTDQLIRFSYVHVVNEETQEREVITFFSRGEEDEGPIMGVKGHSIWDPELNDFMPFDEDVMPESFEVMLDETCGNCLTLFYSETKKEEYIQDHELGDFWLQKVTVSTKGVRTITDVKFFKEVIPGEGGDEEYNPDNEEGSGQDAGLEGLIIYSNLPDDYSDSQVELFTMYEVSSVYEGDETEDTFEMEKASDGDPETAWFSGESEDNEDYPIGEFITFTGMVYNESIFILNGYQLDEVSFKENARVQTMDCYINDQLIGEIVLVDNMGAQQIVVPNIGDYMNGEAIAIKFVITKVYKGTEYSDVGISEIFTVRK